MTGEKRRELIIETIKKSEKPVSGTALAKLCDVSRQVIVQDIALIRAAGYDVFSTNRGYLIHEPKSTSRVFKVYHTDEELEEELQGIVDLGGTIVNVMVNHKVYGKMEAELAINSKRKVQEFISYINSGKSSPLKNITSNYHYHKVEAESEEVLDLIEAMLREKNYLVEQES